MNVSITCFYCLCLGSERVTCNSNCCCALLHTQIKGLYFSGCSRPPPTPRASCSTSDVLSLSKIYLLYIFIVIKCLPSGEKCKVVLNCDYIYSIYMPYLKCTEELCTLGFQTHISSGAWGSHSSTLYIHVLSVHLIQSSRQNCCIKQMCCVFDLVGSSFRMLVMLSFVQCVLIRSMKLCFLISMNRLLIYLFIVMWRNTVLYFGVRRLFLWILAVRASALACLHRHIEGFGYLTSLMTPESL